MWLAVTSALACAGCGGGSTPPGPVDLAPTAAAQSVTALEETPLPITLAGSDPEGAPLTFTIASGPSHGSVTGLPPSVTYTPAAGYEGADAFTFTVSDGGHVSAPATVSITVQHVNRAPAAVADAAATDFATPITIDVLANDSDPDGEPLTLSAVGTASHGTATIASGRIEYAPGADFAGLDAFEYTVRDPAGATASATVSVTVDTRPALALSSASLTFSGDEEGPAPAARTVELSNDGGSTLRWTVTSDVPWLGVSPSAGATRAGAPVTLTISVAPRQAEAWAGGTATPGAPSPRYGHSAVWTGAEVLVWGGRDLVGLPGDGARYDPAGDSWTGPLASAGAPAPRNGHSAVWTGVEMIVWGGEAEDGVRADGARYDPRLDAWRPISSDGAPTARQLHSAVWDGLEMIVWGGAGTAGTKLADGARYDPLTDTWRSLAAVGAPSARSAHAATFTGAEMIVWGGAGTAGTTLADGARYDPSSDAWVGTMETAGAPAARHLHSAVWTGEELIVWGGELGWGAVGPSRSGGRWRPGAGWVGGTSQRFEGVTPGGLAHAAVWDGVEMIVWGGYFTADGARYRPPLAVASGTHAARLRVAAPGASGEPVDVGATLALAPVQRLVSWRTAATASAASSALLPVALSAAPDGAQVIAGGFSGSLVLGPGDPLEATLSAGQNEAYLARFGIGGEIAWGRQLTHSEPGVIASGGWASAVGIAGDGSLMVTGSFARRVTFDAGLPTEAVLACGTPPPLLPCGIAANGFVARYEPAGGTLVRLNPLVGSGEVTPTSIAVLADGTTYVAGTFEQTAWLGYGEPGETELVSGGFEDAFLARFAPDGTLEWAQAVAAGPGGFSWSGRPAVAAGPDGGAWVTGEFNGAARFGTESSAVNLDAGASYDMFLARYGADGVLEWVRSSAGEGWETGRSVAVMGDGSSAVTGFITDGWTVTFGAGEAGAVTFVPVGTADAFVARYRADGTLADLRATSGLAIFPVGGGVVTGAIEGTCVALLADGTALVGGAFQNTATFFPGELVSAGDFDAFVLRAAPSGEAAWVRAGGGSGFDFADAVAIAPDGTLVVAGRGDGVFLARYAP